MSRNLRLEYSARLGQVRDRVGNTGRPDAALVRDYCLDYPTWLGWARQEMQTAVRKNREHEPLAYDIRDELVFAVLPDKRDAAAIAEALLQEQP